LFCSIGITKTAMTHLTIFEFNDSNIESSFRKMVSQFGDTILCFGNAMFLRCRFHPIAKKVLARTFFAPALPF
jgi:hypothetical protein